MLGQEENLFVRIEMEDPRTRGRAMTIVPMVVLPPRQWIFWTQRLFYDRTTPVRTYDAWRAWEQEKGLEPAVDYVG